MVGETGFAPAWACAPEFLRLVRIHSATRRKKLCGRSDLHAHAPVGAAVFKTARSFVPHTAAKKKSQRPESHRHRPGGPTEFEAVVFTISPRCEEKMVPVAGLAPALSTFSTLCLSSWATPAWENWSIHRDVRPARCLTKAVRRSLRVGCAGKSGRSGRTCTFVAREGVAFTARCVCCSATLR